MNKLIKYLSFADLISVGLFLVLFVLFLVNEVFYTPMILGLISVDVLVVAFFFFSLFGIIFNKIQTNKLFFATHIVNCLLVIFSLFIASTTKVFGESLFSFLF